jgi:hypothetical protein
MLEIELFLVLTIAVSIITALIDKTWLIKTDTGWLFA